MTYFHVVRGDGSREYHVVRADEHGPSAVIVEVAPEVASYIWATCGDKWSAKAYAMSAAETAARRPVAETMDAIAQNYGSTLVDVQDGWLSV